MGGPAGSLGHPDGWPRWTYTWLGELFQASASSKSNTAAQEIIILTLPNKTYSSIHKSVHNFSAPIRFASKVEMSIREVKTYPEMYLMSSGYSSGKSYADGHDFQKVKIIKFFQKKIENLRKWTKMIEIW